MTLRNWITDLLNSLLTPEAAAPLISPALLVLVVLLSVASYFLCVRIVTPLTDLITRKTETEWDDDILNGKAMRAFSQLAPALILAWLLPQAFSNHQWGFVAIERVTKAYIVYAVVNLLCVLISNTVDGFEKRDKGAEHNLTVIEGAVKLLLVLIGVIIGLSILFDKEPGMVLTGFGASAAVLMLVFQDTIKGFVAGVQLTLNNMLKKGDWIICDKAGANGAVQSIKLTTVKVQNWDNSIVTIHPYTLISDSFRNYQNMRDMGARRVCRSIYVDFDSIRFLSRQEIDRLKERRLIPEEGHEERNEVNLTHFRKYLTRYLTEHPDVITVHEDPSVIVMVRQLQPTPQGLPLELYFFTHITAWLHFERLQADIFDHVYACIREFGLRIYQAPSGQDFRAMIKD
ncbi:MAG: mechanosensitive ion channel [Bacteroides sp.]|nr:mechanosensitive ion channel [Bacteroides sp.]MBD5263473.1 mechanosensitive ion channel [Bacteroides sp.]